MWQLDTFVDFTGTAFTYVAGFNANGARLGGRLIVVNAQFNRNPLSLPFTVSNVKLF